MRNMPDMMRDSETDEPDRFGAPVFWWHRHQKIGVTQEPHMWIDGKPIYGGLLPPDREGNDFYIVAEGEGEQYAPLHDEPTLYLEFAKLGRRLKGELDQDVALMKKFAHDFGLPYGHPADVLPTGELADPLQPRRLLPVKFALSARAVNQAVEILQAISDVEHFDSLSALATLNPTAPRKSLHQWGYTALAHLLRGNIGQVMLMPVATAERGKPGLAPYFFCDSLHQAIWLQIYQAALGRRLIRPACEYCGDPYETTDRRRKYCSDSCRERKASKNYYESHKKKQPAN